MIKYRDEARAALLGLQELLKELRYDWLVRSLIGTEYFLNAATPLPPGLYTHLGSMNARLADSVRLFRLNQSITVESANTLLAESYWQELQALGLVIIKDALVQLDGYQIVPWLGKYLITATSALETGAQITPEHYQLAYQLMNCSAQHIVDLNCGAGLTTLLAAERASQVTAFSRYPSALAVTRTNLMLNNIATPVNFSSITDQPAMTAAIQAADLIISAVSALPMPAKFQHLPFGESGVDGYQMIEQLLDLIKTDNKSQTVYQLFAQVAGNEQSPKLLELVRAIAPLPDKKLTLFILSRSPIPASFFDSMAQLMTHFSELEQSGTRLSAAALEAHYQQLDASCLYSIKLDCRPAAEAALEVINLGGQLASDAELALPAELELLESTVKILRQKKGNQQLPIDEIQQTIAELLIEDKYLVREIAETVAARHQLSFETAAARTLEFCHELSLQGLLGSPGMSAMRGQMRLIQINVNKFANRLQTLSETVEEEE